MELQVVNKMYQELALAATQAHAKQRRLDTKVRELRDECPSEDAQRVCDRVLRILETRGE